MRLTHAHVFWLGVAANLFSMALGAMLVGWYRSGAERRLLGSILDAAPAPPDGRRRRG